MPNPETPKVVCPFIGKWCIQHRCMMWIKINILVDGKPDVIESCCIPWQLKSSMEVQNELIRVQAGIDKLNNTMANWGGRVAATIHRLAENVERHSPPST